MQKGIIVTLFLFYLAANSHSQPYSPLNDDYNYLVEKSALPSFSFHSAIKPYNLQEIVIDTSSVSELINFKFFHYNKNVSVLPVFETLLSSSIKNDNALSVFAGASLRARHGKSWYLQINLTENINKFPNFTDEKIDSNRIVPHLGRYNNKFGKLYNNAMITGLLQYSPWPFFSLTAGNDKNFIGDGYRSMLLSDNSAPYPFARLNVCVWRLKYVFLYTFFKDIDAYSGSSKFNEKHAVIHFLSYNINERLNLGFFEAVVWHSNDTNSYRGIEPNYFNPMIFFRPVEFSLHSPDNAGLGGSIKIKFWKRTYIYSHIFLDDFIIKQFFKNDGWWGNKYGIQAGFKSFNLINCHNLYFQVEYNFARPYTYSHYTSLNNYGNSYQSLAHPLGANFRELAIITRYSINKWMFTFKSVSSLYGSDTSLVSYGGNIYKPYSLRNENYHINAIQGLKNNLFFNDIKLSYFILPKWNLCFIAGCNLIYRKNDSYSKMDNYFYLGITTLFYNNSNDY
jgi:hypothetical protein